MKNLSRGKNLVKNTIIITIGKVCTQLITFFLLPIYTALLSTEEYGTVDLLNTLVSLCLPIVTFQIEQALFRRLIDNRDNESEIKNTISTTIFTIILQSLIYLILFCIIAPFIHNDYKYFLATNVIACIFSSIMLQIARGLGDNKKYAIGSFITALITVLLNILFIVVFKWGAYGMLSATLIGNIICSLYIFGAKKIYKYISIKSYSKSILKKLWKYSLPLIPNAISWWIFNSSDRIIVSSFLGIAQNGILSASYKFSSVYITIYNIFNMTWTESASLHINDKDSSEFFSRIINTVFKLFTAICFAIIACMPFIFPIMINEKFGESYYQIPILMLSSLFNVVVGLISVIYIAKKDTKAVAKTSIMSAVINLVVNLGLINFIGLYAASISTLAAYLIMSVYRLHDVKKYITIKLEKKFILSAAIMVVILFISYYINNLYLNIAIILITIIYAWLINKNSINTITNMLKNKFLKKGV